MMFFSSDRSMGGFRVEPGGAALRTAPPGLERQDKGPGPSDLRY